MTRPSGSPRRLVRNTKREGLRRFRRTCPPRHEPILGSRGWCPDSGFWFLAHGRIYAYVCELLLAEARQHLPPSAARALSASATPLAEAAAARELQVGRAALASVREEAAAVGQQLLPLRSPAELAILLQVELLYPLGTPKRSYKVRVAWLCRLSPSSTCCCLVCTRGRAHFGA